MVTKKTTVGVIMRVSAVKYTQETHKFLICLHIYECDKWTLDYVLSRAFFSYFSILVSYNSSDESLTHVVSACGEFESYSRELYFIMHTFCARFWNEKTNCGCLFKWNEFVAFLWFWRCRKGINDILTFSLLRFACVLSSGDPLWMFVAQHDRHLHHIEWREETFVCRFSN